MWAFNREADYCDTCETVLLGHSISQQMTILLTEAGDNLREKSEAMLELVGPPARKS
jgi:hypothetical protein